MVHGVHNIVQQVDVQFLTEVQKLSCWMICQHGHCCWHRPPGKGRITSNFTTAEPNFPRQNQDGAFLKVTKTTDILNPASGNMGMFAAVVERWGRHYLGHLWHAGGFVLRSGAQSKRPKPAALVVQRGRAPPRGEATHSTQFTTSRQKMQIQEQLRHVGNRGAGNSLRFKIK